MTHPARPPQPAPRRRPASRWLPALALALAGSVIGLGAAPARADPVLTSFSGSGNVSVFDATAGSGGWVGSLDGFLHPITGLAMPLVSVVLFQFDAGSGNLSGSFELTESTGLGSTLSGLLTGTADRPDILDAGGQFALDYQILAATGAFASQISAGDFGLSFLDFDPAATSADNYRESGLFVTTAAVPEPAGLVLAATALGLMGVVGLNGPMGRAGSVTGSRRRRRDPA